MRRVKGCLKFESAAATYRHRLQYNFWVFANFLIDQIKAKSLIFCFFSRTILPFYDVKISVLKYVIKSKYFCFLKVSYY
jgi:hypothetical protein